MSTLLTETDFEELMVAYLRCAAADGLVHAEIFFDPQAHTDRGVPLERVVGGLRRGIERAREELDVSAELIMCFLRHLPAQSAVETFAEAKRLSYLGQEILGVGLDSAERPFPPDLFRDVFALAGDVGLQRTAHAGEEGPAAYIASALDDLSVTRIDHGIRLIEDDALLERIVRDKVMLTVCPLSNVRLRAVKSVAEVPIRRFLQAGVKFSINSDDPAYFGGYILDNYLAVQAAHALTMQEWIIIATNAILGSWCSPERKVQLLAKLKKVEEEFSVRA